MTTGSSTARVRPMSAPDVTARKRALRDGENAAVVDVGSNSVRLVVYRIDGRAMTPILNEKVMAGLGRDLLRTGKLAVAGVDAATHALRRFAILLEATGVESIFAVATAAVREAKDGRAFAKEIEGETGIALSASAEAPPPPEEVTTPHEPGGTATTASLRVCPRSAAATS